MGKPRYASLVTITDATGRVLEIRPPRRAPRRGRAKAIVGPSHAHTQHLLDKRAEATRG
jgi:hypothetical protein